MSVKDVIVLIIGAVCFSCNTAPGDHSDFTGLYYPAGKPSVVDSSEVLYVSYLDEGAYVFKVSGNSGVGKLDRGVISGELRGSKIGRTPFTFLKTKGNTYEFRAFGSKVDLVKLAATE
jgi:hypothetical protein